MALYTAQIQQLYVAFFNRPADTVGLAYWENQVAKAGGSTAAVANAFSLQVEYTSLYANKTPSAIIDTIYQNLFGRPAELAGLTYWSGELAKGTVSISFVAEAIAKGALTTDKVALDDKVIAATSFTNALDTPAEILGYEANSQAPAVKAWLKGVTDAATLTAAQAALPALVAATVTGANTNPGQTFTLTTSADSQTGTAGNDVFSAGVASSINGTTGAVVLSDTLQNIDILNGGSGVDTLNVTLNGAAVVAPTLTSIENVNLRVTAAASALDLLNATGVTSVTIANSTIDSTAVAGTVDNVGAVATLAVKNQNTAVSFNKSTATTLGLTVDTVGVVSVNPAVAKQVVIDLGVAVAAKATTLNITANASNVEVKDTTGGSVATAVSIAATGANVVKLTDGATTATSLTVTGAGSVDVSGAALTAVKTVTVGDGGVKLDATGNTAATLAVTTGAGVDTLTLTGANLTTVSTGAGNDKVTLTSGAAAAASINLGAGDDTLILNAAPVAGVTLNGGDGIDTFASTAVIYNGMLTGGAVFAAAQLAKVTNFEVLKITDALADGSSFDVSAIAGIGSFVAGAGVSGDNTKNANVTGLAANASVTLAGDLGATAYTAPATAAAGKLTTVFKADTSSDTLNLKLNANYIENNDATSTKAAVTETVDASKIENLFVTSTGTAVSGATAAASIANPFLGAAGNLADGVVNTLTLTDAALVSLTVNGDQGFSFITAAAMTKLATIDASTNTAGVTIDATLAAATSAALTIKGSATAANNLTGGAASDTIVGGAKADVITGGLGGDTLTGNGGNNKFVFGAGDSSVGTGNFDTITDFHANTYGAGTSGAVDTHGAFGVVAANLTGDLIQVAKVTAAATDIIKVGVVTTAADALTYLQNQHAANTVSVALDSSTGNLYVDNTADGVADFYIHLTGVTTINAAAILLV